jgi:hypothetical protein
MKPLIFVFLLSPLWAFTQRSLTEYKASNDVTYHIGDTVKLAQGSAHNHDFLYVVTGGLAPGVSLPRGYTGRIAVIKKILNARFKGTDKIYFAVGVGLLTNYYIYIEDAIANCEIADACKDKNQPIESSSDKYDQLKKLKDLLDQGVLTQEEYDKEKAKLLEGS